MIFTTRRVSCLVYFLLELSLLSPVYTTNKNKLLPYKLHLTLKRLGGVSLTSPPLLVVFPEVCFLERG